jgi:hypothetical protein
MGTRRQLVDGAHGHHRLRERFADGLVIADGMPSRLPSRSSGRTLSRASWRDQPAAAQPAPAWLCFRSCNLHNWSICLGVSVRRRRVRGWELWVVALD